MCVLDAVGGETCTYEDNMDFVVTVRVPEYPDGLTVGNVTTCCEACHTLGSLCVAAVYDKTSGACWPMNIAPLVNSHTSSDSTTVFRGAR